MYSKPHAHIGLQCDTDERQVTGSMTASLNGTNWAAAD